MEWKLLRAKDTSKNSMHKFKSQVNAGCVRAVCKSRENLYQAKETINCQERAIYTLLVCIILRSFKTEMTVSGILEGEKE